MKLYDFWVRLFFLSISFKQSKAFQNDCCRGLISLPLFDSTSKHTKTKSLTQSGYVNMKTQQAVKTNGINDVRIDETKSENLRNTKESSSWYFIREADFADLGTAANILTDGFFAGKTNFITYQMERLKTFLSLESTFPSRNNIRNKDHFMLITGLSNSGKVIGFAELDNRPSKSVPATTTNKTKTGEKNSPQPKPYMCNLAVQKEWKRKGIATALIQKCEEICVNEFGKEHLYLKVRKGNSKAINLYQGLGYEEVSDSSIGSVSLDSNSKPDSDEEILLLRKKLNV